MMMMRLYGDLGIRTISQIQRLPHGFRAQPVTDVRLPPDLITALKMLTDMPLSVIRYRALNDFLFMSIKQGEQALKN